MLKPGLNFFSIFHRIFESQIKLTFLKHCPPVVSLYTKHFLQVELQEPPERMAIQAPRTTPAEGNFFKVVQQLRANDPQNCGLCVSFIVITY